MNQSKGKNRNGHEHNDCPVLHDLHHPDVFERILNLEEDHLNDVMAYRKDSASEMELAFKELNVHTRSTLYADFIKKAGRNIYPVIIALENDKELGSGNGNTFVLYLEDGSEYRITPGLNGGYAVFKSASHILLGLGTILGPFVKNPKSQEWMKPLLVYKGHIERALTTLEIYQENKNDGLETKPVELLLKGTISFINECLAKKNITLDDWEKFNHSQFDNVKRCFTLATKTQAKENVEAILKWKKMLGPELWRQLYVVVPTLWPVSKANPRSELFRALMDEDKIDTNIILSEYPRSEEECRTILGRIVGDRAIARYVFGSGSCEASMKAVGLSTEMDVTNDDFVPALNNALEKYGLNARPILAQRPQGQL